MTVTTHFEKTIIKYKKKVAEILHWVFLQSTPSRKLGVQALTCPSVSSGYEIWKAILNTFPFTGTWKMFTETQQIAAQGLIW